MEDRALGSRPVEKAPVNYAHSDYLSHSCSLRSLFFPGLTPEFCSPEAVVAYLGCDPRTRNEISGQEIILRGADMAQSIKCLLKHETLS